MKSCLLVSAYLLPTNKDVDTMSMPSGSKTVSEDSKVSAIAIGKLGLTSTTKLRPDKSDVTTHSCH